MKQETNTIKRCYTKPTMKIVEVQHTKMLMTSGEVSGRNSINSWGDGGTTDDEIYM